MARPSRPIPRLRTTPSAPAVGWQSASTPVASATAVTEWLQSLCWRTAGGSATPSTSEWPTKNPAAVQQRRARRAGRARPRFVRRRRPFDRYPSTPVRSRTWIASAVARSSAFSNTTRASLGPTGQSKRTGREPGERRRHDRNVAEVRERLSRLVGRRECGRHVAGHHVDLHEPHERVDDEVVGAAVAKALQRLLLQFERLGGLSPRHAAIRDSPLIVVNRAVRIVGGLGHSPCACQQTPRRRRDETAE